MLIIGFLVGYSGKFITKSGEVRLHEKVLKTSLGSEKDLEIVFLEIPPYLIDVFVAPLHRHHLLLGLREGGEQRGEPPGDAQGVADGQPREPGADPAAGVVLQDRDHGDPCHHRAADQLQAGLQPLPRGEARVLGALVQVQSPLWNEEGGENVVQLLV